MSSYSADELLDLAWDAQQGAAYESFAAADEDAPEATDPEGDEDDDCICAELRCVIEAANTAAEVSAAIHAHQRVCLVCLYDHEPACYCTQTDVDLLDARGCDLHDPRSEWNARLRAVTAVERYLPEVA
jgi:hypothetical protein